MNRAAFAAALAATACASSWQTARAADPTIHVGVSPSESYALPLYAADQGFFKRDDLAVDVQLFSGSAPVSAAVAGHSLDIGGTNPGTLANAHARGIPFRVVAPGANYSAAVAASVLVVAKNSPFSNPKDLNGKTIAVNTLRDMGQAAIMKWLDTNGGNSDSLKFVEVVASSMGPAVASGRADAALLLEPSLTYAKNDVRVFAQPYDAIGKAFLITAFFSTADWLDQNPALAKKFAATIKRTADWANANVAATTPILERITKIPAATIAQMVRTTYADTVLPTQIQPVIDILAEYKFITSKFPASDIIWTPKA